MNDNETRGGSLRDTLEAIMLEAGPIWGIEAPIEKIVALFRDLLLDPYALGVASDELFLHGIEENEYLARVAVVAAVVEALDLPECPTCLAGSLAPNANSTEEIQR